MANTIRIKRSASTNVPAGNLAQGELANSESGSPNGINELYIGVTGPTNFKLIRNLNAAPAEPTAGLAAATPVTADYMVFEDVTDSQGKRVLFSATPLTIFNNDAGWEANQTLTTGVGISGANAGSTGDFTMALDFSELTDMTGAIAGTTEFILQDGTTESRKAASEIDLSAFNNDSGWTSDVQQIHADYAFSSSTTSADPGAGTIRFNNATPASVTALYIDDVDNASEDWGWILSNLATNDIIVIRSVTDPADYLVAQVSGATTDNTGWWTVPVTVLFSGSLPTAADVLQLDVQWFSQGTAGTVSSVTAGTGLINTGSASAVVLDLDFSELTDMTASISGTTEFILQNGTTESRKTANEIDLQFFNNSQGWEANQTITTGTGIDGADAGSTGNITLSLAFDEVGVTSPTGADWIMFDDAGVSSKALISSFDVGLFNNATAEYVSENDTMVVADWNWVLDEDTMATDSAVHVPTQQSVKAYVDNAVTGGMVYKGGYDAATNTPALDTGSPSITIGDTYTVTVAGNFFTEAVQVGDVLIAEVTSSDAASLADWTIVNKNIPDIVDASETAKGIIEIATQAEVDAASSTLLAVVPSYLHNTTFDGGTF